MATSFKTSKVINKIENGFTVESNGKVYYFEDIFAVYKEFFTPNVI
jgi:hypothetical protein